ncbi:MAG: 2-oxoglutarate dehydrogenase complex dihydrolipoyllysine-residue succinyltransferase [Alphaproteobacteria bacterium]|nr:2-oxoglutarate dehydrogenase complex dihydrolipoyllysine-residue succinyltransferase [Alphaproteobacteria bacterium]
MAESLIVPALGESVKEATVAKWLKKPGDTIKEDETLVELETDKVTVEVNAPFSGTLVEIIAPEGAAVEVGDVLGAVAAGEVNVSPVIESAPVATTVVPEPVSVEMSHGPAVRRMAEEEHINVSQIQGTGRDGRVTKEDLINFLSKTPATPVEEKKPDLAPRVVHQDNEREERVPMSRLRQTIARRLKEAQQNAAMLTTFNEVDMTAILDVRNRLKDRFEQRHGVKLGFMSFFVKACVEALKEIPAVNASIDGNDFIYKHYYDIGVAIGAPQGLVVPIVRDADMKSFAQIEKDIADYALKAKEGKLSVQDMTGGTFTVSNGGTYGSLMSTPILNPPQSGILGMHKTEKRPVVVGDKIEIRPMMYLALSYDHRIVDGKEAVTFLVRIKDCLEDPERMLLNV